MTQPTPTNRKVFYCEPCGFRKILEDGDLEKFIHVKTSPIQKGIPLLDPKTNKTALVKNPNTGVPKLDAKGNLIEMVTSISVPQPTKVKCPRCGRANVIKGLYDPFAKALKAREEQSIEEKRLADLKQRIEDGKPLEKKPEDIIPPKVKPKKEFTLPPPDASFNG